MTKRIKKTSTRTKITIQAEVDGKTLTATTIKKCVGKYVEETEKCQKCQKAQPNVGAICRAKTHVPAKTKKKASGPKPVSVVELTVREFFKGNTKKQDIVDAIEDGFPGRTIGSTVSSALCVLRHVDTLLKGRDADK